MATKKYKMQPIMLPREQIKWLKQRSKVLSKEWNRYVSISSLIRMIIDSHI